MKTVDKIREQRRATTLAQMAAKPHRARIVHLHKIRSIGIITPFPTDEEQITLSQFMHHMTQNGSNIRKIEMPQNLDQLLDKYGLPHSDPIQNFTKYHYDLLINALPADDTFGLYITLEASSNLRVAYHDTSFPLPPIALSTYDLFIRGQGPIVLSRYLTDLLNLLVTLRNT